MDYEDERNPFGVSLAKAVFDAGDFDEDIEKANKRFRRNKMGVSSGLRWR